MISVTIILQAEGTEETQVQSLFLALSPNNSVQTSVFDINLPSNVVEGSTRFSLSVSGKYIYHEFRETCHSVTFIVVVN